MIPEGDEETPEEAGRRGSQRDALAARRARRAGLGDPVPLRRPDTAEATVQALEGSLADVRRRLLETEHERERATQQLAEREHELRRVKQREYAEQQLRVEAEEHFTRLRRGHHAELDRLRQRVGEARAAAQLAQERRTHAEAERDTLAAHLDRVSESCARLQASVLALHRTAAELRVTFEREYYAARARIRVLERDLAQATAGANVDTDAEARRRAEMASALATAVERLRARVGNVGDAPEPASRRALETETAGTSATAAEPLQREAPTAESAPAEPVPAGLSQAQTARSEPVPAEPYASVAAPTAPVPVEGAPAQADMQGSIPARPQRLSPEPSSIDTSDSEIPTVFVVPRLFAAPRRPRLATLGRRLGLRLVRWADRAQDR